MAESIGAYASGAPIIKYEEIENIINSSWLILIQIYTKGNGENDTNSYLNVALTGA
ncbi:hypothetical protein [Paenibacillus sp. IHBB 10380]|uniref:hypothetical protein n=1 Tax=Paenibacillus sp. IHBB 10380 TaxID=1566358 RepID=UPI000AE66604|nr:hypothetical protein [Paenibacillus sp. IHBB 10380]